MNYWREGTTTTRVLIIVIIAGALCIVALLCLLVLGLLGVLPPLDGSQPGTVSVPASAPGVPTVKANTNVDICSGPGLEYPAIGIVAIGTSGADGHQRLTG